MLFVIGKTGCSCGCEVIVEEEKPKPKRQLSEKQKASFEKARKVLAKKMQYVKQRKKKRN